MCVVGWDWTIKLYKLRGRSFYKYVCQALCWSVWGKSETTYSENKSEETQKQILNPTLTQKKKPAWPKKAQIYSKLGQN